MRRLDDRLFRKYAEDADEAAPLTGPWQDVGEGRCQRCKTERRLYSPLVNSRITVCALCAESTQLASIPRCHGMHDEAIRERREAGARGEGSTEQFDPEFVPEGDDLDGDA